MHDDNTSGKVFLCYARTDSGPVKQLYERLQLAGFSPWADWDIMPGEKWHDAIMRTIREAPFFLACLSGNSVDRRGVIQEEIKEALQMWRQKLDDDIYLIPVRLEECKVPESLARFQWVDIFADEGFEQLTAALRLGLEKLGITIKLELRSEPVQNLSEDDVTAMLQKYNFYDHEENYMATGIHHQYVAVQRAGESLVVDHTTGLTWQQGGSSEAMSYAKAKSYIAKLNKLRLADFSFWRLPTLEEAMSLITPRKNANGLFTAEVFDNQQLKIWTTDSGISIGEAWGVNFLYGFCDRHRVSNAFHYVRVVCSGIVS